MSKFAEEQLELLDGLESNSRVVIEGGAGSGKTLLAIEAAKRISDTGKKVLFTCVSEAIIDQARMFLDNSSVSAYAFEDIPKDIFDVLVIDEGQDIVNIEDVVKLDGCLRGGLHLGSWWLFSDPNNQAHVSGQFDADVYHNLKSNSSVFRLKKNHRNTRPIVEMVKQLLGADLGTPKIGAGPSVKFPKVLSKSESVLALDRAIAEMLNQGIHANSLNFVTFCEDFDQSYVYETEFSHKYKITSNPVDGYPTIWSPARIKGLERDHVFVTDIDDLSNSKQLSKLYVSMTRAKVSLWVGVSQEARSVLDEIARTQITNEINAQNGDQVND